MITEYLTVDFTAFPIRVLRAGMSKGKLSIIDFAQGPQSREMEAAWLSNWIKTEQHFFRPTNLLALWDSADIHARVRPAGPLSDTTALSLICELPEHQASPTQNLQTLEFEISLPQTQGKTLFDHLSQIHGSCHKISVLPMSLWAAFLSSYPDYLDRTVAIIWGAHLSVVVLVIDHGILTLCRYFNRDAASTQDDDFQCYISRVKEALEQYSFLFPLSAIDHILIGGDIKSGERLIEWIAGLSNCHCEFATPFHSDRNTLFKKEKQENDVSFLASYWPCLGLIWELQYPWETLYHAPNKPKEVAHVGG